jgi:hypothetical protein
VAASLIAILAVWPAAQAGQGVHPRVVCVTQWDPHPKSSYRFRPHRCDFHDRRASDYAHYVIATTARLHWRYWNARRALAHGKIGLSTYGLAPVRVKLTNPRTRCGHRRVFTKGRFKVRIRVKGGHRTFRFSMPLDVCTH